jgi:DNA-binding FadR family transcriptional regulator
LIGGARVPSRRKKESVALPIHPILSATYLPCRSTGSRRSVHSTIANATSNRCLEKMIRDLRCRTQIFNTHRIPSRLHPGALEHLAIMKAIAAGDRDKSRALIGSAKSAIINELTASGNAA